jgi:hypothetical protein
VRYKAFQSLASFSSACARVTTRAAAYAAAATAPPHFKRLHLCIRLQRFIEAAQILVGDAEVDERAATGHARNFFEERHGGSGAASAQEEHAKTIHARQVICSQLKARGVTAAKSEGKRPKAPEMRDI